MRLVIAIILMLALIPFNIYIWRKPKK